MRLHLAMSGTPDPLVIFLRAAAAERSRILAMTSLPYGTLAQWLVESAPAGSEECILLTPWDFVPAGDWRSGVSRDPIPEEALREDAERMCALVSRRAAASVLFLPAPMLPVLASPRRQDALERHIHSLAAALGAIELPAGAFSLSSHLSSGCPIAGASLGEVARRLVDAALAPRPTEAKVLVTDLDHVLWSGVVAEDGVEGIAFEPSGRGYRHFVYQSMLRALRRDGVLLTAVSRNDAEVALAPLRSGRMLLGEGDFAVVAASYHAKSAQIRELAARLNLGLDAFVFVDDNPVELAEVSAALPEVRCIPFPARDDGLPALLGALRAAFPRETVTDEDRARTELYRTRLAGMVPAAAEGADLSGFLRDLGMTLTIFDRSTGDRTRAVQLVNKTNQFNLNGVRLDDARVDDVIAGGGRLYTATLEDRHGAHGEILACLVDAEGRALSLVMSCRVFQRRTEYAFLAWLARRGVAPHSLAWSPTPRNGPLRDFLVAAGIADEVTLASSLDALPFDAQRFLVEHGSALELLTVREAETAAVMARPSSEVSAMR